MRYRRKQTEAEAFRLSADVDVIAPPWFTKAVEEEKIWIDRSLLDGHMHVYGCTIRTAAGKLKAKVGDYVVKEGAWIYPCRAKDFLQAYEKAG